MFSGNADMRHENLTMEYEVPYSLYMPFKITNMQLYKIIYLSLLPFAILTSIIPSAADCLIFTLGFHLCAQLRALTRKLKKTDFIAADEQQFKVIISTHQEVLRYGYFHFR